VPPQSACGQTCCCLQVQTNGDCEPNGAMQDALKDLQNEFSEIHDSFMVSSAAVRSGSQS
jgi:DNA-directed RNA polymerase subunit L